MSKKMTASVKSTQKDKRYNTAIRQMFPTCKNTFEAP